MSDQSCAAPSFVPPFIADPKRCRASGHDWRHMGGANAGCGFYCSCSVPVYECMRCGDCDYGHSQEADEIRAKCKEAAHV